MRVGVMYFLILLWGMKFEWWWFFELIFGKVFSFNSESFKLWVVKNVISGVGLGGGGGEFVFWKIIGIVGFEEM